ncbi:kynurenine formamidase-like [Pollicipes pollicipes]|uniref:kynurenine formamidase-like n=1 Tax=Pollicipes pollicipes TaxID=41117 RepID=UPI0018849A4D|nr:kynurenine formamidase-like [Pollicipes pollicipes]
MTSPAWRSLTSEELERQYSPSAWVRRVAPSEVVRQFVEALTAQSQRARRSLPCDLGLRYGPGPEQRYNVLGTDVPDNAPLAVFIHGGFWQMMDLDSSDGVALGFRQLDWRTATVGYDLAPAVSLEQIERQALALRQRSRALLLFGHSAGAQLAAAMLADWSTLPAAQRPLVGAAVYVSGVFDLEPLLSTTVNAALRLDAAGARRHSPLRQCATLAALPEFRHVVLVGEHDSPEFVRQTREFAAGLRQAGCRAVDHVVAGRDHFDVCEALADAGSDVMKVVQQQLADVLAV